MFGLLAAIRRWRWEEGMCFMSFQSSTDPCLDGRVPVLLPALDKRGNARSSLLPWKFNFKKPPQSERKSFYTKFLALSSAGFVAVTDKSLHKIGSTVVAPLVEIKLKVQLNTARRHERREIIILDFLCLQTEKEKRMHWDYQ